MAVNPVCRGLVLCEKLVVEERSRNVTLVNCFSTRVVPVFPSPPDPFVVYAVLAGGRDTIMVTLRITRLSDGEDILHQRQPLTFPDPVDEVRFLYRTAAVVYPTPGRYEVVLESDDGPIAETRVEIRQRGAST